MKRMTEFIRPWMFRRDRLTQADLRDVVTTFVKLPTISAGTITAAPPAREGAAG
jgi:hypothetical protein